MKREIANPYPDNNCFFCGKDNEKGLHLKFYWDEETQETSTDYFPHQCFIGQGKILHGGIQMGMLDEIMGWTCYVVTKSMAVTSGLEIRFLRPVYVVGERVKVKCRVVSKDGTKVTMIAELEDCESLTCTTATGTYHLLGQKKFEAILHGNNV